ncbi:LysR family transcriptional regulator [Arthrobacter sp. NQ7]|uniref:LysR family transcriptional regulator n=1 Tax=Arthrobacter sp. NQ7 TaxID=3032303 RepID=UPI0024103E70|nr:LysR family transcriptional regulator [Arthrobacter sp. NQ7]MDJ0460023.1 LysR family transcriptional regulator [Arthrobacter sp. NQ7]
MTMLQVNYFLAATAAGSLTQAAEELGISQPTLSEQIRKLEQSVGVPLFTRAKQGLTLTEAGQRFLPHARKVARDYEAAMESVSGIRDSREGTVAFGMFNSGQYVLSGLIPAFRSLYPNIHVRVIGSNSAQVADMVRSGRLEAGVVALPIDARGLTMSDVLWSCEAAYFHTKPVLTEPVTIEGLLQRPLVLPDSGWAQNDPTRRQLSERAQALGKPFVPDIEVETGAAALAIAASGTAAAVASVPVAEALGYTNRLNHVSLDPPLIETFAVISRDPTTLSPATKAMIKLAEEHMRMLHREYQPV